MFKHRFRIQFDLSCWCLEASRYTVLLLSELAVACLQRHPHPAWLLTQCFQRYTGRAELVAIGSLKVAVPKVGAETQAARQVEDDLVVGAGLTLGRDHPLA